MKSVQATVQLSESERGILLSVRSATGTEASIVLSELEDKDTRDAFMNWAAAAMQMAKQGRDRAFEEGQQS